MTKSQEIRRVHQVLITDDDRPFDHLPVALQINSESHKAVYPYAYYRLWGHKELRSFIGDNFPQAVLAAFDTLQPYSYKSDLARFCILLIEGGMYIDLAVRSMNALSVPSSCGVAAFRDVAFISPSWSTIQTGLLWAEPGRPEFNIAIDWIVENCARRYYGENPLYPTGPVLLGRAFIKAMADKGQSEAADDQRIGECRCVTPEADLLNMSYVSKEGVVVGLRTKIGAGDLTHLGLTGVNNYNEIWRARRAYGETERVWAHDDPAIRVMGHAVRGRAAISVPAGALRRVTFGPYADLDPGRYQLTVELAKPVTDAGDIAVEVSAFDDNEISASAPRIDPATPRALRLAFVVWKNVRGCEFRVHVKKGVACEIVRFTLAADDSKLWSAEDRQVKTISLPKFGGRVILVPQVDGRVLYGPYAEVEAGSYDLSLYCSADTQIDRAEVEISSEAGKQIVATTVAAREPSQNCVVYRSQFQTSQALTDVEFRVSITKESVGQMMGYVLTRTVPASGASGLQPPTSKPLPAFGKLMMDAPLFNKLRLPLKPGK